MCDFPAMTSQYVCCEKRLLEGNISGGLQFQAGSRCLNRHPHLMLVFFVVVGFLFFQGLN